MDQRRIRELLEEAASDGRDWRRLNAIQVELMDAIFPDDGDDRAEGFRVAIGHLYVDTLRHRRQSLPALFPVFALLCGDRDDSSVIADIDWTLVGT